jgi:hypothetical protein
MRVSCWALSIGRLDVKVLHPNQEQNTPRLAIRRVTNRQRRLGDLCGLAVRLFWVSRP